MWWKTLMKIEWNLDTYCYIKKETTMATLDDKLMGEKLHYYCSSSEDEEEENPGQGWYQFKTEIEYFITKI